MCMRHSINWPRSQAQRLGFDSTKTIWIHTVLTGQGKPGFAKEENGRGNVGSLCLTRRGFAERSRERRASETAEHDYHAGVEVLLTASNCAFV